MYNYEWDIETGGYILLPSKITGVTVAARARWQTARVPCQI